jgi:flavin-binding protein dodecin
MGVAQVSEISATSVLSFEDAIRQGLARAGEPRGDVRRAWIKDQQLRIGPDSVPEYLVNLLVTFVIETPLTGLATLDLDRALSMADEGGVSAPTPERGADAAESADDVS